MFNDSSINSFVSYLNKEVDNFEFSDSFIALKIGDNEAVKDKNESLKIINSYRENISLVETENEDSHKLLFFTSNGIKYISKIKEENNEITSIFIKEYKGSPMIQLFIEYDGSSYSGMQRLPKPYKTIQGEIEDALYKMLKKKVEIRIASRTDKGVHAKRQCVSFESSNISASKYMYSLNLILNEDIRVVEANEKSEVFDARFDVVKKEYEYLIDTGVPSVYKNKYVLFHKINDIKRFEDELKSLEGTFDFDAFSKGFKEDTVRTIYKTEVIKEGSLVKIRFNGNGFLHNMIRFIVGSLLHIDEVNSGSLKEILLSKEKNLTPYLASPAGLYLTKIEY